MKLHSLGYALKQALKSIKRNGLMSLISISTVTITLSILGILILLVSNLNFFATNLEQKLEISTFLAEDLSQAQQNQIEDQLLAYDNIQKVTFVSKEEALKNLEESMNDKKDLFDTIRENNPLPDSFEVHVNEVEGIPATANYIKDIEGVEEVYYGQDIVERLLNITKTLRKAGTVFMVLLLLATMFLISNTIKLTVFARRKEIEIMKLVGATNWFIRWPFILEGIFIGSFGSVISICIIFQIYRLILVKIYQSIPFIPFLANNNLILMISISIFFLGFMIGTLGSGFSLRKFLDV